jgi:hypothetical protein
MDADKVIALTSQCGLGRRWKALPVKEDPLANGGDGVLRLIER